MESVLDIFNPQLTRSGSTISVTYCHGEYSGVCIYEERILRGPKLTQDIVILVSCEMGDVIEWLYREGKIFGSGDMEWVNREIRDHSLSLVDCHRTSSR
jgi:hypothetical protein